MSILSRADEARTRMKEEEPERYAAEGRRIEAELAICKAIAAMRMLGRLKEIKT